MKTIFRVAKTELRSLFYSPIAWFIMIVFFIQCGLVYLGYMKGIARTQELGGQEIQLLDHLTFGIFVGNGGLFSTVMQTLYLYIPLLTMNLISRETGSGTIKLLYSSPIDVREIVLGKYLAMLLYNLVLTVLVAVFVVSGLFHIRHPETGMLMTGLLGFYLLLCAYSAIGLFMSTLSNYQVVSAIASFIMIGVLSYIGQVWQRIAFVRELTYFLSLSGRTQKLLMGLVTTKDLVYFLVIVYLFLGFSIYRLKGSMESKPWPVKALRYAGILAIGLLVGYVASIPGFVGYLDVTHGKTNTVNPRVEKILKDLGDEPLEVTAYANLVDHMYFMGNPDSYNQNIARWDPYLRFKDNIRLRTVSYYDSALADPFLSSIYPGKNLKEIADQAAKKYDMDLESYLTPAQIRKMIDLTSEGNRYVMQLKWKGRTTWLRVFDDSRAWPGETEVAVALRRLQGAKVPRIAFVTGHLERAIDRTGLRDYSALTNTHNMRNSLINQGFDVEQLALDSADIPDGVSTLVLADPKLPLSPAAMARLTAYIDKGGNVFIAGEPGNQALVNPLLRQLGVQLRDGVVVQENEDDAPTMLAQLVTPFAGGLFKPLEKARLDSMPVTMPVAAALSWNDSGPFTVHSLLVTKPGTAWNRAKPFNPELMIKARAKDPGGLGSFTFSPADGDLPGPLATAIGLTRKINNKEQRIVVTGDADFINNTEIAKFGTTNFVFSTALFSWLSDSEFPVDASRPDALDKRVKVTLKQTGVLRIVYVWIIPAIFLLCGTVLLIRRKRK